MNSLIKHATEQQLRDTLKALADYIHEEIVYEVIQPRIDLAEDLMSIIEEGLE